MFPQLFPDLLAKLNIAGGFRLRSFFGAKLVTWKMRSIHVPENRSVTMH